MADGPHERIKRYLKDAHALEVGILDRLKDMAGDTRDVDPAISQLYAQHATETQSQADRLEMRLKELGDDASGGKSMLSKLASIGSDISDMFANKQDKTEQGLMMAYAAEHMEMAVYSALKAAAETLGDEPTARLAEQLFNEEKAAGDKIFPHVARFSRQVMLDAGAESPEEQEENLKEYADQGYVSTSDR
jgi:ferritin-like metal-binding protein YciE